MRLRQVNGSKEYVVRPADPDGARELGRSCGLGASIGQVLLHRGIRDDFRAKEFLYPRLRDLTSPEKMVDREAAAERLCIAIRRKELVVVFGDYDVDGTTGAVLLTELIRALGGVAECCIADRFDGGYGLSDPALKRCLDLKPSLMVTCDCGSSDHERLERARRQGVDVLVVDHHLVPSEPLPVMAFINPHRPECGFPYKGMASVGLALSLAAEVRRKCESKLDIRQWLDLVALGTIADVAPLDGDNRKLVRAGLAQLAGSRVRPGVAALRKIAGVAGAGPSLGAVDVAFRLVPRLNAPGRLGEPELTARLLLSTTEQEAETFAARVDALNQQRREISDRVTREARVQVEQIYGSHPSSGVVVAAEGWHRGVVGIAAARLVDAFGVPAVVIAHEGSTGHGSGRAPEGFPLYCALNRCRPELLNLGGHQAAAGLSLLSNRTEAFRRAFADSSRREAQERAVATAIDVHLDGCTFDVPADVDLDGLEPVGEANAEPLFAMPLSESNGVRRVGEHHLKLRARLGRRWVSVFGPHLGHLGEQIEAQCLAVGALRADRWRGNGAVELVARDLVTPI